MVFVGNKDIAGRVVEARNHSVGEADMNVVGGFVEAPSINPINVAEMVSRFAGDGVGI